MRYLLSGYLAVVHQILMTSGRCVVRVVQSVLHLFLILFSYSYISFFGLEVHSGPLEDTGS